MNYRLLFSTIVIFEMATALPAQAPSKPPFLSAEELPIASFLPNPPAEDSAKQKDELQALHRLEQNRQPDEVAHAKADDREEDIFIFKDILGQSFTAANLPKTAILSAHLHQEEGLIVNPAKHQFHRLRPFHFDSTLKPVCKVTGNKEDYGYPSGHATTGYLEALSLIMIVPEQKDAILARADDYAHSRLVCGVHYESDITASKYVAYSTTALLLAKPAFQDELELARKETRQLLKLP